MAIFKPTLVEKLSFIAGTSTYNYTTKSKVNDLIVTIGLAPSTAGYTTHVLGTLTGTNLAICSKVAAGINETVSFTSSGTNYLQVFVFRGYAGTPQVVSANLGSGTTTDGSQDPTVNLGFPRGSTVLAACRIANTVSGDSIVPPADFETHLLQTNANNQTIITKYFEDAVSLDSPVSITIDQTPAIGGSNKNYSIGAIAIGGYETRSTEVEYVTSGTNLGTVMFSAVAGDVIIAQACYKNPSPDVFSSSTYWTAAIGGGTSAAVFWHRYNGSTFPTLYSLNTGVTNYNYYSVWRNVKQSGNPYSDVFTNGTFFVQKSNGAIAYKGGKQLTFAYGTGGATGNKFPTDGTPLVQYDTGTLDFHSGYHDITSGDYPLARNYQVPFEGFANAYSIILQPTPEYVDFSAGGLESGDTNRETGPWHDEVDGGVDVGTATIPNHINTEEATGGFSIGTGFTVSGGVFSEFDGGVDIAANITNNVSMVNSTAGSMELGSNTTSIIGNTTAGGFELASNGALSTQFAVITNGGTSLSGGTSLNDGSTITFSGGFELDSLVVPRTSTFLLPIGSMEVGSTFDLINSYGFRFDGGLEIYSETTQQVAFSNTPYGAIDISGSSSPGQAYTNTTSGAVEVGANTTIGLSFANTTSGGMEVGFYNPPINGYYYETSGAIEIDSASIADIIFFPSGGMDIGDTIQDVHTRSCRLRLKSGSVESYVGYMWVPVFFRVKDFELSTYTFYTLTGIEIPHLIRNTVENEVRAMVYLDPRPDQDLEFIVTAG